MMVEGRQGAEPDRSARQALFGKDRNVRVAPLLSWPLGGSFLADGGQRVADFVDAADQLRC